MACFFFKYVLCVSIYIPTYVKGIAVEDTACQNAKDCGYSTVILLCNRGNSRCAPLQKTVFTCTQNEDCKKNLTGETQCDNNVCRCMVNNGIAVDSMTDCQQIIRNTINLDNKYSNNPAPYVAYSPAAVLFLAGFTAGGLIAGILAMAFCPKPEDDVPAVNIAVVTPKPVAKPAASAPAAQPLPSKIRSAPVKPEHVELTEAPVAKSASKPAAQSASKPACDSSSKPEAPADCTAGSVKSIPPEKVDSKAENNQATVTGLTAQPSVFMDSE